MHEDAVAAARPDGQAATGRIDAVDRTSYDACKHSPPDNVDAFHDVLNGRSATPRGKGSWSARSGRCASSRHSSASSEGAGRPRAPIGLVGALQTSFKPCLARH